MVLCFLVGIQTEWLFLTVEEVGTTAVCLWMYSLDLIVNAEGVNNYGNKKYVFG